MCKLKKILKYLLVFISVSVLGQNTTQVTWPLTTNLSSINTGTIISDNVVLGSSLNNITHSINGLSTRGWSNNSPIMVGNEYYEYSITATDNIEIKTISGEHSVSKGTWSVAVYYSTDNFLTSTQVGNNMSISSKNSSPFTLSNLSIMLNGLENLKIRIYAWNSGGTNRQYRNKNITISCITYPTTTWDGVSWDNGVPTIHNGVIFTGNYSATQDLRASTVKVSNNSNVIINSGYNLTVNGAVDVISGSLTLQNNSNLVQFSDVQNTGNIIVNRNSSPLMRLDYTLWSSPVTGQELQQFSTGTLSNRFYTYNVSTNLYTVTPTNINMDMAAGYLIRMPNTHPTTPTIWNGVFTGVPNNGTISKSVVNAGNNKRYNLVGNPYPSTIDAVGFVESNINNITGTLYFWRKTNGTNTSGYCLWNTFGFTTNGDINSNDPLDVIQVGQGFFVELKPNINSITFDNSMRFINNNNIFFKNGNVNKHRIWLNVKSSADFSQMMIGYTEYATMGVDDGIDGLSFRDNTLALTSLIGSERYGIQGRPTPFSDNDVVNLHFDTSVSGTFTISIANIDGLFSQGQVIYLRDNITGIIHNLTDSVYTFTSDVYSGNRFDVLFTQQQLNVNTNNDYVGIVNNNDYIDVVSREDMESISLYDISGRLLRSSSVKGRNYTLYTDIRNQVLLIKVVLSNGRMVSKKIIR